MFQSMIACLCASSSALSFWFQRISPFSYSSVCNLAIYTSTGMAKSYSSHYSYYITKGGMSIDDRKFVIDILVNNMSTILIVTETT